MKDYLIPLKKDFYFGTIEQSTIKEQHMFDHYYYKYNDFSVNIEIQLKLLLWGYEFLTSISNNMISYLEEHGKDCLMNNSINGNTISFKRNNHEIFLDSYIISEKNQLLNVLEENYDKELFNHNSIIHMKLKLNLDEFIILQTEFDLIVLPLL